MAEDVVDTASGEVVIESGKEITDKVAKRIRELGFQNIKVRKSHLVPYRGYLDVQPGQRVSAGDRLTEGPLDPQKVLDLQGVRGVQEYLVREIQVVYKSQGVDINDKHIEIIVRQMLKKRKIRAAGDTDFLPGQIVDKFEFEDENRRVRSLDPPGTEATADWLLLGITEASLATDSFLSAASFQKTTRVLTEAAVRGKRDNLVGLKENVIIGRLIPAGTGLPKYRDLEVAVEAEDGRFVPLRPSSRPMTLHDVGPGDDDELPNELPGGPTLEREPLPPLDTTEEPDNDLFAIEEPDVAGVGEGNEEELAASFLSTSDGDEGFELSSVDGEEDEE
jgi:DNA-directed RNA polymerase subunit beta'